MLQALSRVAPSATLGDHVRRLGIPVQDDLPPVLLVGQLDLVTQLALELLQGDAAADFRLAFTSGVSANSVCFERELLDHFRLVFEKTPGQGGSA